MKSASKELGYPDLKPEQLDVLETFVKGHDLFAGLPTGMGRVSRSLLFLAHQLAVHNHTTLRVENYYILAEQNLA